jgi:hypothetical protein
MKCANTVLVGGSLVLACLMLAMPFKAGGELSDGLVAHWKFDEGEGDTAYDSAGGNHGTLNGPTWTTGQIGEALSFDGTEDDVFVGDDDSLDITAAISFSS